MINEIANLYKQKKEIKANEIHVAAGTWPLEKHQEKNDENKN